MGYVVLHFNKAKGNEARTSKHIEREVDPPNADKSRTHLNKEWIDFPDGVNNRTQAIQHRIKTAGVARKITSDQVRVIRVNVSGTHKDMIRIQAEGRIDEWCKDSLDYFKKEFGEKNIVSAVLHMDEKTPHMHIALVPIVIGKRRKAKEGTKVKDKIRLCADDVLTKTKMEGYQDSYAAAMSKYGLKRGVKGSKAKHRTTAQYYRDLYTQNEDLKENIGYLEEQKQEVYDKVRDMYDRKDELREKFLNLHEYTQQKETEISETETRLERLKQEYEPYKAQDDINLLLEVLPTLNERLRIVQLCKGIGLAVEIIKQLFSGESVPITGQLHSPEYNQSFNVQDAKLQIFKERDDSDKLLLKLNGQNIMDWFKQKYQEVKHSVRTYIKPSENKRKGFRQ